MTSIPASIAANATKKIVLPFTELVAIVAAVMALNALAIDMMLPALGIIGEDLGVDVPNHRQRIIVFYVLANGFGQLLFGPIVDRFGRKPVLMFALAGYVAGSALSVFASSFSLLLAARVFQGFMTAATRVAAIATVRDICSGRKMAEVMSLSITVFMAAPILAPGFGQIILSASDLWRAIFVALLVYGLILMVWLGFRLPETLTPQNWRPLNAKRIINAYGEYISNRVSIGYTVASALCFGALFGYISTSEQVFHETFDVGNKLALYFAIVAASLGAATIINARLVSRFGMRRLTHGALLGFVAINLIHLVFATTTGGSLPSFMIFMCISFFALGLIGPNSTAMAMEPMGHIAGLAAAANGFAGTTVAGFLGGYIGSFYDGTVIPIIAGFFILGILALCIVLWTEKGELFQPHTSETDTADDDA